MYKKLSILFIMLFFSMADAIFPVLIGIFLNRTNQCNQVIPTPNHYPKEPYNCADLTKEFAYLRGDQQEMNTRLDNLMQNKSTQEKSCLNKQIAALICLGANPNWKHNNHYNLLDHAKESDDNQLMSLILEHDATINKNLILECFQNDGLS